MAVNSEMLSTIASVGKWISGQFGPSRKTLNLRISDLEDQISRLSAENQMLGDQNEAILRAVLTQLQTSGTYCVEIKGNTIIITSGNNDVIGLKGSPVQDESEIVVDAAERRMIGDDFFERVERKITESRRTKPSDRS